VIDYKKDNGREREEVERASERFVCVVRNDSCKVCGGFEYSMKEGGGRDDHQESMTAEVLKPGGKR